MSFDVGYVAEFGGGVRINLVSDAHYVAQLLGFETKGRGI